MEIKICINGFLNIKRGGKFKQQNCPWTAYEDAELCRCGDWCPHFGEILSNALMKDQMIELCNQKKLIGKITDARSE